MTLLLFGMMTSCSIEKRKYNSGYHTDWNLNKRTIQRNFLVKRSIKIESPTSSPSNELIIRECENISKENNYALVIVDSEQNDKRRSTGQTNTIKHKISQVIFTPTISIESSTTNLTKISAEVHPHAFSSLICGILAAGSLVTMFIASFSPAALVAALLISIIVFSLLAIRLAKSANSDMYYARNRYSGRGLASAGLVLGIITLVALIGFIAVLGITVVFGAFA